MDNRLIVLSSAHIHSGESVSRIMWLVTLSLIPAGIAGVILFGGAAFGVIAASVAAALATEGVIQRACKRKVSLWDGSAVLTGLLLAYNLPADVPWWLPTVGAIFAIAIGKQIFGGLGQNIFNPALAARAFLMACWPSQMTAFRQPLSYDAVTCATPLAMLKEGKLVEHISYLDLFLGKRAGCLGEVCIVALLAGALFLFLRGYISWHVPITYIGSFGLFMFAFGPQGVGSGDWLFHILTGGVVLGAFFMATDYVTSPLTRKGQVIFGLGCGILTAVIRLWGGYPEGASYAILMMNAATPFIDRYTKPRVYGT